MKNVLLLPMVTFFSVSLPCVSDESKDTAVIGEIYTSERVDAEPQEPIVERDFVVKQTFRQKMGKRSVTIQEVEPPVVEAELAQSQDNQAEKPIVLIDSAEDISPEFIVVTGIM